MSEIENDKTIDYYAIHHDLFTLNNFDYKTLFKNALKLNYPDIDFFIINYFNLEEINSTNLFNFLFLEEDNNLNNKELDNKSLLKEFIFNLDIFNNNNLIEPNNFDYSQLGIVTGISDNIVSIVGLYGVAYGEMIEVLTGNDNAMGMVLNIEENKVSAIIFSSDINIKPGQEVLKKSMLMSVPVGDNLLGRIVDPLGNPLDSKGPIIPAGHRFMDSMAPSIISRKSVDTPLEIGLRLLTAWFLLDMVKGN